MKRSFLVVSGLLVIVSLAFAQSPYSGQQHRSIKSLSAKEVESLKSGAGMGFAKLAELNHYPGPKHVLELASELGLTPAQLRETEALFAEMRENAIALGEELLEAESALDRDFQQNSIDADSLRNALLGIGDLRAKLRYVHLEAHLRQKRLLTEKQLAEYDKRRGYNSASIDHSSHSGHHH